MIAACAFASLGTWQPARAETSVLGRWLTDDGSGVVEIAPCHDALCGRLVAVLDPRAPTRDINNPDPAKRRRPLVGIAVLTDLARDGDRWDGGRAYDPKAGRSYRARIRLAADGGLDVTGCLFVLCRTRHWTRPAMETRR